MERKLAAATGAVLALIIGIAAGCGGGSTKTVTQTVTSNTTGSTTASTSSTESRTIGSADSGNYGGTAERLVPSLREYEYDKVQSSSEYSKPSTGKKLGFQSGWDVSYRETNVSTVAETEATIYVYDNQAHAKTAYDDACPACKKEQVSGGVLLKYTVDREGSAPVTAAIATCRNIYVAVFTGGTKEVSELANDAGNLVGVIFGKAMAQGMANCNATKTTTKPKTVTKTTKAKPRSSARRFSGNGGKTLPPVTVYRDSTLSWANDGAIFQIYTDTGVPVNSQSHSGNTFLAAGTYTLQVNAVGNWTIKIAPG